MSTRRRFLTALVVPALVSRVPALAQTPEAAEVIELTDRVLIDHYRVISGGVMGTSVVGAMINSGTEAIDVPLLIEVVLRDDGGAIVDSSFAQADYPVLPAGTPMGFEAFFPSTETDRIDPDTVNFDAKLGAASNREVERLNRQTVEVVSAEVVGTGVRGLEIACEVINTSPDDFENGLSPRVSVWDVEGFYCGHAYANVFMRIPAGDTAKFTTMSHGGFANPLDIAGDDYTWDLWIDPR